jgi:hypothetical protein
MRLHAVRAALRLARRPRRPRNRLEPGFVAGVLVALVLLGVALGGVGFARPVTEAAPREAPAHKIARLRAKAVGSRRPSTACGPGSSAWSRTTTRSARPRSPPSTRSRWWDGRPGWPAWRPAPRPGGAAARPCPRRRGPPRSACGPAWSRSAARSSPAWPPQRRYHQRLTRQVRRAVAQERRRQEILRRRALLRRPGRRPGGRVRPRPAGQAVRVGGIRAQWGGGAMVEAPYFGARVRISSIGRRDYIGAVRPTG